MNLATDFDFKTNAFLNDHRSLGKALNEEYWRHGITINQGIGWSVSQAEAQRRLNYIRVGLLRRIFGNNFRRIGGKIWFCMFTQGSRKTDNQHFHAVMGIEGHHDWSDQEIAEAIDEIDRSRRNRKK